VKRDGGLDFREEIKVKENINGFEGVVYFRFLRRSGHPLRIKLDFTQPGMERIILEPELRKIIHPYSDELSAKVITYQLEEIMAEKLRALFQRTRPRDLYDVWFMRNRPKSETILKVFSEKCKDKDIILDINSLMIRKPNFAHSWENSLKHLIRPLPNFINTFEEVIEIIRNYFKKV
jgi:predicted nucleotidyltransferase component of viral defense system